jgi:DNA-binding response OmpR family regulator
VSVRVLIVENEFMIGLDVSLHLASAGYDVVGPVGSVRKALKLEPRCDVAVLDVNLGGETSEPVARKLRASGSASSWSDLAPAKIDCRRPWQTIRTHWDRSRARPL